MEVKIFPSTISGKVKAPSSKSSMQRACALALLSKGETVLKNIGFSNDDKVAIEIIQSLGAKVLSQNDEMLRINSLGEIAPVSDTLDCGEAGLGIRMFTPIATLCDKKITINGRGSLLKRPMSEFETIFSQLNVSIKATNHKVPFVIEGAMKATSFHLDGSLSSQYLTGLLMCFAYLKEKEAVIHVSNLKSKPYVDLTLSMLKQFGVVMTKNNDEQFAYQSGHLQGTTYDVESDWSGGAFLLVAGATLGDIEITGLDIHSTQADKKILEALDKSGVSYEVKSGSICVYKSEVKPFDFDATECPDLFPPLVALASAGVGRSSFLGAKRLIYKESNRAKTLKKEMAKFGINVCLDNDMMIVEGKEKINILDKKLHSHNDHRIAMANTLVAMRSSDDKGCELKESQSVKKSYPYFFKDLLKLNAKIEIV